MIQAKPPCHQPLQPFRRHFTGILQKLKGRQRRPFILNHSARRPGRRPVRPQVFFFGAIIMTI